MARVLKLFLYVLLGIALAIASFMAYLNWFQPPFYFPRPTGPYAVGSKEYHWIDSTRKETLSNDPAHPYRELMVKIWYPAAWVLPEKPSTPYAPEQAAWLRQNHFFFWLCTGISRPSFTHAQNGIAFTAGHERYPVILFSPGGGGIASSNTAQCEELASHGYVVVGISHPYDSWVVHFPDGRIVTRTPENVLSFKKRRAVTDEEIEVRIADMRFVLDEIEQLVDKQDSFFCQRIDLAAIGVMGQSFGGAAAVQLCRQDRRIRAGIDMDGSLFGRDATAPVDKPLMFLLSDTNATMMRRKLTFQERERFNIVADDEEEMFKARYPLPSSHFVPFGAADTYTFIITGAGHSDFTDSALRKEASILRGLQPLLYKYGAFLLVGRINGLRATEIVNAYLVNFFDKYLKGKPSALLNGGEKRYPEVEHVPPFFNKRDEK